MARRTRNDTRVKEEWIKQLSKEQREANGLIINTRAWRRARRAMFGE